MLHKYSCGFLFLTPVILTDTSSNHMTKQCGLSAGARGIVSHSLQQKRKKKKKKKETFLGRTTLREAL